MQLQVDALVRLLRMASEPHTFADHVQRRPRKPLADLQNLALGGPAENVFFPHLTHLMKRRSVSPAGNARKICVLLTLFELLRNSGRNERSWDAVNAGFITLRCLA